MTGGVGGRPATARAWAELLRVSALFSVPGDALAGAAAAGCRVNRGTALAVGTSLCLYEAGMALNDWSDREEDGRERPGRPLPSGRIAPGAALGAAVAFTGAGLGLAAVAGRGAFGTATALAGTVWAYDLGLKHTRVAPATMATARALDLLLGATATRACGVPSQSPDSLDNPARPALEDRVRAEPVHRGPGGGAPGRSGKGRGRGEGTAGRRPGVGTVSAVSGRWGCLPWPQGRGGGYGESVVAAGLLGAHTFAVTSVSRHETSGGSSRAPLAALATVAAVTAATVWPRAGGASVNTAVRAAAAAAFAATAGRPLAHAALNPFPPLLQRAVGGGIRAMIPLQATLAARAGAPRTALAIAALAPVARRLSRKVSPT